MVIKMGCRYCNFDGICEYFVKDDDDGVQLYEIAKNCDEHGHCLVEEDEVVDCEDYIEI